LQELAGNADAAGNAMQPPRYCDEFHGVECCSSGSNSRVSLSNSRTRTGAAAADARDANNTVNSTASTCFYEHVLTAVALRVNHMNGSLQDAALMDAIFKLEACGLEVSALTGMLHHLLTRT
jgi:hypothetical protein